MIAPAYRGLWHRTWDWVFPRRCVHSGDIVRQSPLRFLSPEAYTTLRFFEGPGCGTCGLPLPGVENRPEARCDTCATLQPAWRAGRCALEYKDAARSIVHTLKFRHGTYLSEDLGTLWRLAPGMLAFARGAILVPVPLAWRRQFFRGFNQAEVLARALGREAGVPVHRLLRRRPTTPQVRLSGDERRRNVRSAFQWAGNDALVQGQRVIVIDDVLTTGATLQACARILYRAGASTVDIVALARGGHS